MELKPERKDKIGRALGIAAMAVALLVSFHYSGVKGVALLSLGVYAAYKVSRHLLGEVHVEKFIAIVFGVYFSLAAAIGLVFKAAGVDMSPINFVIAFGILSVVMNRIGKDNARLLFEYRRVLPLAVIFVVGVAFYLYPTYPNFGSACVGGFDCMKHTQYAESIHDEFKPLPPIDDWSHYPYGTHVNVALMAHMFSDSMDNVDNFQAMRDFMYRFMVVIMAATVAVTCGLILDRGLHWVYAILAAGFMLMGVYPASALMGHGFWAQIFGMFFVMLFGWSMSEYIKKPSAGTAALLGVLAVGDFLSYQLLTAVPVLMAFLLMLLLKENSVMEKIKHAALFFAILGLFAVADYMDNYRVFLNYDGDIFRGVPGAPKEQNLTYEERHTVNLKSMESFIMVGRKQMIAGGSAIFINVKRFGVLAIFLAVVGLLYSARNQDHPAILFEAVIIFMLAFYLLYSRMNAVSPYYYSKMAYLLFYPLTAFAFIGLHEVVDRSGIFGRPYGLRHIAAAVVVVVCVISLLYVMSNAGGDSYQTIFGQSMTTMVWDMVTLESKNFGEYILKIC